METVTAFIFLGSKITADGDCSLKIKRRLLLERKAEISPCSWTTMVLHPTTGFVNSAPTEHLDGNEALAVKTSLALATVDFVGMHMRRLGQVTV